MEAAIKQGLYIVWIDSKIKNQENTVYMEILSKAETFKLFKIMEFTDSAQGLEHLKPHINEIDLVLASKATASELIKLLAPYKALVRFKILVFTYSPEECKELEGNPFIMGIEKDMTEILKKLEEIYKAKKPIVENSLEGVVECECICPISQEIMKDPVIAADGHTYDRESIEKWLSTSSKSPLTGADLPNNTLIPNLALKKVIAQLIKKAK